MGLTDLLDLRRQVADSGRRLQRQVGEAQALAVRGKELQREVRLLEERVSSYSKAQDVLSRMGEERQEQTQQKIEALVTHGLKTIFDEDLSFHLVQSQRGKQTTVSFSVKTRLEDGTYVETDVLSSRGGGMAAVIGFLLRLVVKLLSEQGTVFLLDETFAHLSDEYEPRLAEFIRDVVDKTGTQVVLVTHSTAYSDQADVVYRFSLRDGRTTVVPG